MDDANNLKVDAKIGVRLAHYKLLCWTRTPILSSRTFDNQDIALLFTISVQHLPLGSCCGCPEAAQVLSYDSVIRINFIKRMAEDLVISAHLRNRDC